MMTRVNPVLLRPARGATGRAATGAAEITAASSFAHWCAGGAVPSVPWIAGYGVVLFAFGLGLQRGKVTFPAALVGASAGQLLMHLCLQSATPAGHVHDGGAWPMVIAHVVGAVATAMVWTIRRRAWDVLVQVRRVRSFLFRPFATSSPAAGGLSGIETWLAVRLRGPPVGC